MKVKQGRTESPQQYHLLKAYFGSHNEPGMEEELNFKSLFFQNLHPANSHHLGVMANPRTSRFSNCVNELHEHFRSRVRKDRQNPVLPEHWIFCKAELEGVQDGKPQSQRSREGPWRKYCKPSWPSREPTHSRAESQFSNSHGGTSHVQTNKTNSRNSKQQLQ